MFWLLTSIPPADSAQAQSSCCTRVSKYLLRPSLRQQDSQRTGPPQKLSRLF